MAKTIDIINEAAERMRILNIPKEHVEGFKLRGLTMVAEDGELRKITEEERKMVYEFEQKQNLKVYYKRNLARKPTALAVG